jgi:hypothetical protein
MMHSAKYFIAIALAFRPVWSHPRSLQCDIGKICPWGYGEVYTISEAHPDVSSVGRLFQVSQRFGECGHKKGGNHEHQNFGECGKNKNGNREYLTKRWHARLTKKIDTAFDRVYTIINLQFSGLGANGCELVFNVPCNNTTPIYHTGPIVVEAKALSLPAGAPTWNNVVNANPPLTGTQILGTFQDFYRNTFTVINPSVCMPLGGSFSDLAFIFETPQWLHQSAELKFNQTVMNEDIVTGVYVNFTC